MRDTGFKHGVAVALVIEPREKPAHLLRNSGRLRCFIMDALAAERPRNDLHWPGLVIAPDADSDSVHATAPGREQRRVPAEEPLFGERLFVVLGGVEHHFYDAFDIALRRCEGADIHAEA